MNSPPIAETRKEILRLIARLHRVPSSPSSRSRRTDDRPSPELAVLRGALSGKGSDLAEIMLRVEARLARIETKLGAGGPVSAAGSSSDGNTLSGIIAGQLLADSLQLISSNSLTGTLVITSSGVSTTLYMDEGQICHAVGEGTEGEGAVFVALAAQDGNFVFREHGDIPKKKTIESNTQFLILEALRRIDEGGQE